VTEYTVQGSLDPGQGSQVRESLDRVLRWTSRRANRLRLYGRAAELSQNEVWLLDAVDSAGQLRLSDLATWQGVDKSTITPQVRKLEERGLLQRSSDATDRRAVRLVLTPRGRALQKRRAESGAALIDALLQDWPLEDRVAFAGYFLRFADQLDDYGQPTPPPAAP
jgi:DNA-binding MarR family transcriptional regulator